ncbi:thiamine pyrophosphate-dependent dehydrogenase E1 component subunit alpha [Herbaspirillum sp. RTI4]|uniref:thiamine pyrophosphate-dependent dehydrogenase E1 component subunit alpha n=1 Tax=Herbaspirillum sp. RTI4 TaxID=3048640 RepID=UPI002AB57A54|nr:thiamine pyrophosphate-dependent dehydrogenase E1 component subunit alpha [Herbaspirillum sp. RTI4]MDY7577027.1 thiamine pyrophosphate-dependent dehydrogenase E1 component subunit alpha [Herbaspirillum sp. RTI4]MEA9983098.1 thiamine pyrophosphate-dependent dehydrogenase E1 component subunit alpha [Herbaspirillum sp. RTI4]
MTPAIAQQLLFSMKRIRHVEEEISRRYAEQAMRCPVHLCSGQEAVSAAAGLALRKDDFAVSGHRAHGHYLGKGGDLRKMLAEIYGKKTGCAGGRGGSMHLIDESVGFKGSTAIVGNTIPVGVGLGYSIKLSGTDQVSCIFLGDGAVETGVFYESLNFAAVKKLPVLFLCENNLYSVYSPLNVRQPVGRDIFKLAQAIGVNATQGDGNDAAAVYHQIAAAVADIRAGNGPQFIEFSVYRWREHCGPGFDNDIGYRSEQEYLHHRQLEPVQRLQDKLRQENILLPADIAAFDLAIQEETDAAFRFAIDSPFPSRTDAFAKIYA